jgi:hypothetical protein
MNCEVLMKSHILILGEKVIFMSKTLGHSNGIHELNPHMGTNLDLCFPSHAQLEYIH